MIDTRMPAVTFARKLRARRTALKAQRAQEMTKYKQAVARWREVLRVWIIASASSIAAQADAERSRYREYDSLTVRGMPQPPKLPSEGAMVRKIDSILRRLALTGQKHVTLVPSEIDELFGDTAK